LPQNHTFSQANPKLNCATLAAKPMKPSAQKNWTALTWDNLEEWAGARAVSRGQYYQRDGRVEDLAISEESRLLATVVGGEPYTVSVWLKGKAIQSQCTCPVGVACKHAVAVVAEYLELVAQKKSVPQADPEDPRWEDVTVEDDDIAVSQKLKSNSRRAQARHASENKIEQHIRSKSQKELADLVWSLTQRFPELHEEFRERIALGEGAVDQLVKEARRELRHLTSEPGWVNSWTGEGHVPDYSRLIHRLERLIESGHPDAVVKLGEEIIEQGMDHAGQSHDEGETGSAFSECFPVIFQAVAASSLSPAEKLLYGIDSCMKDDYGLIGDAAEIVMDEDFEPAVWSEVADTLARRLATRSNDDDENFSRRYRRDQLTNWITEALQNAGRGDEALAIYEREARRTHSYERLVKFLIEQKRYDEARRWAREGIEKTVDKLPGIATSLARKLSEVAQAHRQWDEVAAHAAWQFFDEPGQGSFKKLIEMAGKAACAEKVRELALRFLETGILPVQKTGSHDAEWPLPVPDYIRVLMGSSRRYQHDGPHYHVLIDMAIEDKLPDAVLHWYDKMCAGKQKQGLGTPWGRFSDYPDRVAEAVAHSHPERSLEIYRQRVSDNLGDASKSAYETVVRYLRKIHPILKRLDREKEWTQLIADIRQRHRNRPKLMEMLDRLNDQPIVKTLKR
jgi:uncharacterized Zn finger protein